MRVVETLGVYKGAPVHVLYRRESRCVRMRPLGNENHEFCIDTESWQKLLGFIEGGERTTFGVSVPSDTQAPYRSLYSDISEVLKKDSDGAPLNDTKLSCISAILYHEGVLIHYSGVLGQSEPARMILRRSKTNQNS